MRVPDPPSKRLNPMPADKILFPRRMIYIEAVLYLLIAAAAFGMGYLIGRGGGAKAVSKDSAEAVAEKRVPLAGRITFSTPGSAPQADAGSVVIVLPNGTSLNKPLAPDGFRPGDPPVSPSDSGMKAITSLGGATTRAGDDGSFTLVVPKPGVYQILIISRHAKGDPTKRSQWQQLNNYFDPPAEVLGDRQWKWFERKLESGMEPIKIDLSNEDLSLK